MNGRDYKPNSHKYKAEQRAAQALHQKLYYFWKKLKKKKEVNLPK